MNSSNSTIDKPFVRPLVRNIMLVRLARKGLDVGKVAAPWGVTAYVLLAYFATPALNEEYKYRIWTLGLYGGPHKHQQE
jgi:hypothetical protein